MNELCDDPSDGQLEVLREFVEDGASIDGDVLEIVKDTWVVHGVVGLGDPHVERHRDRKSTRLNSSHTATSRMPSSA